MCLEMAAWPLSNLKKKKKKMTQYYLPDKRGIWPWAQLTLYLGLLLTLWDTGEWLSFPGHLES